MESDAMAGQPRRVSLVLSGGGARGAYEAGVLSHLFDHVYPRLEPGFEFDIVSGTSVGAIHAAYVAASAHLDSTSRGQRVVDTWRGMAIRDVLQLSVGDLLGIPLRALGIRRMRRRRRAAASAYVIGGLVDISPLERLVDERIHWSKLRANLAGPRPRALCVSCTEVRSGRATVFMDGPLADPAPWSFDPNAQAEMAEITASHVRASAAIPFIFPAVLLGERYYVDGGLRMNTPLSPALRLESDRVLVVALKYPRPPRADTPAYPEDVITQPAFLLGKVLDALMLDQLDYELHRIELVNAWIDHGRSVYGAEFLDRINVSIREQRGVSYRRVDTATIRPSRDLGKIAAECYARGGNARSMGMLPALITRAALHGVPENEADLLSYLYFDACFTSELIELGREDARRQQDEILALLSS